MPRPDIAAILATLKQLAAWRGSGGGSIRAQLRRIVWSLLGIQALLAIALDRKSVV